MNAAFFARFAKHKPHNLLRMRKAVVLRYDGCFMLIPGCGGHAFLVSFVQNVVPLHKYNIYFGDNAWKTPFCPSFSACGTSAAGA